MKLEIKILSLTKILGILKTFQNKHFSWEGYIDCIHSSKKMFYLDYYLACLAFFFNTEKFQATLDYFILIIFISCFSTVKNNTQGGSQKHIKIQYQTKQ